MMVPRFTTKMASLNASTPKGAARLQSPAGTSTSISAIPSFDRSTDTPAPAAPLGSTKPERGRRSEESG